MLNNVTTDEDTAFLLLDNNIKKTKTDRLARYYLQSQVRSLTHKLTHFKFILLLTYQSFICKCNIYIYVWFIFQ